MSTQRTSFSQFYVWSHYASIFTLGACFAIAGCKKTEEAPKDDKKSEIQDDDEKENKKSKDKKKKKDKDKNKDRDEEGEEEGKKKKKKTEGDDDTKKGSEESDTKGVAKTEINFPQSPLSLEIEGQKVDLLYGTAASSSFGSGLRVTLSNEKTSCKGPNKKTEKGVELDFDMPVGPKGSYFVNQPIGVSGYLRFISDKKKTILVHAYDTAFKASPFKAQVGEKVKGSIVFDFKSKDSYSSKETFSYKGAGSFEVEICQDILGKLKKDTPLSEEASSEAVTGSYGTKNFTAKSALVRVSKGLYDSSVQYVDSIELYATDDVTCENSHEMREKQPYLKIDHIGGASNKNNFTGTPQPADPTFYTPAVPYSEGHYFGFGHRAWVNLESLTFKNGATIKGSLVAESLASAEAKDKGKLSGKFTAKVCSRPY